MAKPLVERFWSKVDQSGGPDACWTWTASKDSSGYGTFWVADRCIGAHRVAYELVVGEIPAGLQIDHLCCNKACQNPAHMEPVTQTENIRRRPHPNLRKTHCPSGHPYDETNTGRSHGRRRCRTCSRDAMRRRRAVKREATRG